MQTQPRHGDCCQGDNIKEQPSLIRIPSEGERESKTETRKEKRGQKRTKGGRRKTVSEEVQRGQVV